MDFKGGFHPSMELNANAIEFFVGSFKERERRRRRRRSEWLCSAGMWNRHGSRISIAAGAGKRQWKFLGAKNKLIA
jgi:hypothetical protein